MVCFMCGLDARSVKLTQARIMSATRAGKPVEEVKTVCTDCKELLVKGNHPDSAPSQAPEQPGFIKPSSEGEQDGGGYPPVRPE
jgi:hypothetical protein